MREYEPTFPFLGVEPVLAVVVDLPEEVGVH